MLDENNKNFGTSATEWVVRFPNQHESGLEVHERVVWENQTTGWLARKWEDPCQAQAGSRRGADHCHHLDESGVESDGENDVESGGESDVESGGENNVESDGERDEKRVRGVDQCQLHGESDVKVLLMMMLMMMVM